MPDAVIVSAARTPIGRAAKGSLVDARPDDLAGFAIKAALDKVPELPPEEIVDVMIGCGFPQEKQGMNLGRRAALLAGLPHTVPGTTVNRFCASSLQTIRMAFHAVRAGEGEAFVAGGVESISQVNGYPKSDEELHMALFGDNAPIANVYIPMGLTAENVAEQWDVSREDMDRFAQQSQERAVAAQDSGLLRAGADAVRGRRHRRRAAPLLDAREAAVARPRVQAGRQGDGRQRVPAERRRGRRGRHVRRPRERARDRAARAHHRVERLGRRAGDHGRRPDRGRAQGARAGRR